MLAKTKDNKITCLWFYRYLEVNPLDTSRNIRYKSKISYILECLNEIESELPTPSGIVLKGVFFDLSTAIEAAMDMIAMLCKDRGILPKGDYENIQSLKEKGVIDDKLAEALMKCNGLRNFLVHRYNGIDDTIVLSSIQNVKSALMGFIRVTEAHLDGP